MANDKRGATTERTKSTWLNGHILYERVGAVSVVEVARKWRVYQQVGGRTKAQALGFEYKRDDRGLLAVSSLHFMGAMVYERCGSCLRLFGFLVLD